MLRFLKTSQPFKECLELLSHHVPAGEVHFRDLTGDHEPHKLLQSLSSIELKARITQIESIGSNFTRITILISGLFSSSKRAYEIIWSSERQGWTHPHGMGKSVHYYVPGHYIPQERTSPGMLISLCKRSRASYEEPFFPKAGPRCKTCQTALNELTAIK